MEDKPYRCRRRSGRHALTYRASAGALQRAQRYRYRSVRRCQMSDGREALRSECIPGRMALYGVLQKLVIGVPASGAQESAHA